MLLIYDHKCNVCRNLAYKIHISTNQKVEIKALSDPDSTEILDRFYPAGWSHDFYVVDKDTCRKGVRALGKLIKPLGAKGMAALLSEYSAFKIARTAAAGVHNGTQPTRRTMLKYAALAPVITGLSRFSLADPFKSTRDDFKVHIAQVTAGDGPAEWATNAWRCEQCVQSVPKFDQKNLDVKQSAQQTMLQNMSAVMNGGATGNLQIVKTVLTTDTVKDGAPLHRVMDIYAAVLEHPRFRVTFNIGNGPVTSPTRGPEQGTSVSVLINHDLPIANVDMIAFESSYELNCNYYPDAYRAGIQALEKLHRQNGSSSLAQLYREISATMPLIKAELAKVVPDTFIPIHSKAVITSLPELMKFISVPSTVNFGSALIGCDCSASCSCSCSACCGCGCSIGLGVCIPPIPACGCGCCASCGCGCGACCGCST